MNDTMIAQQQLAQALQTYQMGDLTRAEEQLRDLLEKFPKSDQIAAMLGMVLFGQKKYKEAFRQYRQAVKLNPQNCEAVVGMASAEHARGNTEIAIALSKEALKHFPGRIEVFFNLGTFYIEADQMEEAENCFLKSLELEPRLHQAHLHLVNVYKEMGQLDKVAHHLRKLIEVNPDPQLKVKLKEIEDEQSQTSKIQKTAAPKITTPPLNTTTSTSQTDKPLPQAITPETAQSRPADDTEIQSEAQPIINAFGIAENDAKGLLTLAETFFERYQYKEARAFFEQVLSLEPENAIAKRSLRKIKSADVPLWHFEMLADKDRNDAYQVAIERALKKQPQARVLDIGTGSGLLSMMAARAGASEVLACEMHPGIAEAATNIVKANGYDQQIKVLNHKSSDLKPGLDYLGKYDVVVSEILDVAGIGEGVLPSLRHAFEQILRPGAISIPSGMTMYAQLASVPDFYRVNPIKDISGFDLSIFNEFHSPDKYIPVKMATWQHEMLSEPVSFHSFDFHNIPEHRDEHEPHSFPVEFKAIKTSKAQAVIFWFHLHLDEQLSLSSGPGGKLQHWGQAVCFLDNEINIEAGGSLSLNALMNDLEIWFEPIR